MKVLLISWYFPPTNDVGAVRVGKLARHLRAAGKDVWVLSANRREADNSLQLDFPADRTVRTDWFDVDKLASPWILFRKAAGNSAEPARPGSHGRIRRFKVAISKQYASLVRIPDRQIGWLPPVLRAGTKLLEDQGFDVIYASGPPFTTFIAAAILSRKARIPWVAEYRDGWSHDLYSNKPKWRIALDEWMEDRVTKSASGIVAVSEPWARYYEQRFSKPTIAIYNGYDDDKVAPQTEREKKFEEPLTIAYLGELYSGLRDPSVLYRAVLQSGLRPTDLRIRYYGPNPAEVMPLASRLGVEAFIDVAGRVPYHQSLSIQRASDILLLLQPSNDPANVPAKTFEYFAARRPILGLGLDQGIPAQLINERGAGFYVSEVNAVAQQLRRWSEEKQRKGYIPDLTDEVLAGLSRSDQFHKLNAYLSRLTSSDGQVTERDARPARPVSSLLPDRNICEAKLVGQQPKLIVLIDAEEEFDWNSPFSKEANAVTNIRSQYLAHKVFEKFGIVPTYAVDYPVAHQCDGIEPLLEMRNSGCCHIGAQLHPWVTPPHEELVCERNSYPGNLPLQLERAKLEKLTRSIEDNFDLKPLLYRAGRYGTGPNSLKLLSEFGYKIDCSVLPGPSPYHPYAPDYSGAPVVPYWPAPETEVLEIPVTSTSMGYLRFANSALAQLVASPTARYLKIPAILAGARIFDRVRLSPEGIRIVEAKRLTRFLLNRGQKVFVVSYHSPSLVPGNTPYVSNSEDRAAFLHWLESYFEFFFYELKGTATTPEAVWSLAHAHRSRQKYPESD